MATQIKTLFSTQFQEALQMVAYQRAQKNIKEEVKAARQAEVEAKPKMSQEQIEFGKALSELQREHFKAIAEQAEQAKAPVSEENQPQS